MKEELVLGGTLVLVLEIRLMLRQIANNQTSL